MGCSPKEEFEYSLKIINPARLSELKTVNIRGKKHCASLDDLHGFLQTNLSATFDLSYLSLVDMGFVIMKI